jgi:hypothetical protein
MKKYQVNYQRRDMDGQLVKGSVIHRARYGSRAIDLAIEELKADEDTKSFVILEVKEV